jgi:predicted dienelactone hydrolase
MLGAALVIVCGCGPDRPYIELPEPTGPYAVGTMDMCFVDTERAETFTPDTSDHREVPVRLWYPAEVPAGSEPLYYLENVEGRKRALEGKTPMPLSAFDELAQVRVHSHRDADLPDGEERFPVLLFSHGYAGGMLQNTVLMEDLASHGYVTVSVGHPYETSSCVRGDGTILIFDAANEEVRLRSEERRNGIPLQQAISETEDPQEIESLLRQLASARPKSLESIDIWVGDIRLVIDELERMERGPGFFSGRLDLGRIGVLGHSFGGIAAGQACLVDDRCRAGINIDGLQLGDLLERNIARPFMFVHHDNREAANRTPNRLFCERAENTAYLILIRGTRHFSYSDMSLPGYGEILGLPDEALGTIDGLRSLAIQNLYFRTFFDKHLREQDSGLLDGPSTEYPEVVILVKNGAQDG